MTQHVLFVYDDRSNLPSAIAQVVGKPRFGALLRRRQTLMENTRALALRVSDCDFLHLEDDEQISQIAVDARVSAGATTYIHMPSWAVVVDARAFHVAISKAASSPVTALESELDPLCAVFPKASVFLQYLQGAKLGEVRVKEEIDPDAIILSPNRFALDISALPSFLAFFSGGSEARFFNEISRTDEDTLSKSSTNQDKIEAEYKYYDLLPERMRRWFVMPFGFERTDTHASYRMERFNVPDLALQWIHGAVSFSEFKELLRKIFAFIEERPKRSVSKSAYDTQRKQLYIDKVTERFRLFRDTSKFEKIDKLVAAGTSYSGIEAIIQRYIARYKAFGRPLEATQAVGHGDLCFSNILYDKTIGLIRFVDPKGATSQSEMWSDPYYDLAKLSHSVLGGYDFINNGLFEVQIGSDCQLNLSLKSPDLTEHRKYFLEMLQKHGFDPYAVRLHEASLFLSMLALHVDHSDKVLGFALRACDIIEELEKN